VGALEEAGLQAENQVKELKETIFELDDQVEQQRAVHLHTNQTVLDMESMYPLCSQWLRGLSRCVGMKGSALPFKPG
jgi:flagellar biosynthesis/type III secretory pathway chaperone